MRASAAAASPANAAHASAAARGGDDDDLGANWRSALCVTSLYDSYVQLQQESDALKSQVQELQQQKNELLAARQGSSKQRRGPPLSPRKGAERPEASYSEADDEEDEEDASRYAQLRREIQLLRGEKDQMELVHAQYRKQSEAQLEECKEQFSELSEKYQVRYALDPNSAKRVALAVQTLQETLEKVAHEKEELSMRYAKLQQLYSRLQQEQSQTHQLLQAQVQQLERKQADAAKKIVVSVLHKWYASQLAFAWQQWTRAVALERLRESGERAQDSMQNQRKAKEKQERNHQAARILLKFLQNSARRTFLGWCHVVQRKREALNLVAVFRRQHSLSVTERCFKQWQRDTRYRVAHRASLQRLSRVFKAHKARLAWKKWTQDVFVTQTISHLRQQHQETSEYLLTLETKLEVARSQLAAAERVTAQLTAHHDLERLTLEQKVHAKHSVEAELLKRIGSFFAKQSSRQLLQCVVREWKAIAEHRCAMKKRTKWVSESLQRRKVRRSVIQWHVAIQHQRRYVQIVSHFVSRMRHTGVLQYLNAWKRYASGKKERDATVRRVILKMRHKHLSSCFERWTEFKTLRLELKTRLAWKQHSVALAAALESSKQRQLQRDWELRFEQSKMDALLLRRCLLHWRQKVQRLRVCKKLAARTLGRWRNGLLARVLTDWQRFVGEQQRQRELITRWLRRVSTVRLQAAWLKWQKQIVLKTQQQALARAREEHDCHIARLHNEIEHLRCAHQQLVASKSETTQSLQLELADVRRAMQVEARRQERYALAFERMANQKERVQRQRKWFRAWVARVAAAKRNHKRVLNFVHRIATLRASTVFRRWNQLRKQRALLTTAVTLLRSFMDQYRKIQSFGAWQERMQSTRAVRQFHTAQQQRASKRQCRVVLREWRREARTRFLVRRTAERIWLYSVHLRVKELFAKWVVISRHERFVEQKAKRKELLASIQTRVFCKWTSCSLRVVFDAWARVVRREKRCRRAERKLAMMQRVHVMSSLFSRLRANVLLKSAQRQWLRRWIERLAFKAQSGAFTTWKAAFIRLQRQEIDALRSIRGELDAELLRSLQEAEVMAQASRDQEEKLTRALESVAQSESAVEQLRRQTILQQHFRVWGARAAGVRRTERMAERFAAKASRRRRCAVFSAWRYSLSAAKASRVAAETRSNQRARCLLTRLLCAWSQRANDQLRLGRKLKAIANRKRSRMVKSSFTDWREQVRLRVRLCQYVPRLNKLARRACLHSGFATLRALVVAKKKLESKERERQKRIMEFITGRHGWSLERVFGSWRAFTSAQRGKHSKAHQRLTLRCTELQRTVFAKWRLFIKRLKAERALLRTLFRNLTVHCLRVVVSTWRRQVHTQMVSALRIEKQTLAQQIERVRDELSSKDALVQQAQARMSTSNEQTSRLEALLTRSSAGAAQMQHSHQRDMERARTLVQIAMQRLVSRQVLIAFSRWKSHRKACCDLEAALLRLQRIWSRKQRGVAFSAWKSKSRIASRLESAHLRATKRRLHFVVETWKRHCRLQLRSKVLLMRLCTAVVMQRSQSKLTVCGAFRILQKHAAMLQVANESKRLKASIQQESRAMSSNRRELLLAKWSWRAYAARLQDLQRFFSQCRSVVFTQQHRQHTSVIQDLQSVNGNLAAKLKILNDELQLAEQERSKSSEREVDERSVLESSFPGVQTLFRQLAQVGSTSDLFGKVASAFPQILHGSSAILFLHDPSSNELWTQREDARVVQVPASLGIAGYSLSSCSTVFVDDVSADQRFHAMVDQFVVSTLRQVATNFSMSAGHGAAASVAKRSAAAKATIALFSSALVSHDGSVCGVLQVAFSTSLLTDSELAFATSQAQLLGRLCCFYVEQMLFEIVRSSPDRVRARIPDKFIKLFKQNKNWRKYYVALERRARQVEEQLLGVSQDRDALVVEKAQVESALERVRERLEAHKRSELEASSQIVAWKKKMNKLKALVELKDREIVAKSREADAIADEFVKFRRTQRSKGLQALLSSSQQQHQKETSDKTREQRIDTSSSQLLRADNATLRNQLVRAESDSILLVRAIDVACKQQGELPDPMRMEVNRIALRLRDQTQAAAG